MNKKTIIFCAVLSLLGIYLLVRGRSSHLRSNNVLSLSSEASADCFQGSVELQEADSPQNSASALWWVNSGARANGNDGTCSTVLGSLPPNDKWRQLYSKNNPLDTDDGYHPQNIFRFVRTTLYRNVFQEMDFKIVKDNLSESPNRNASNGVLFFLRYLDSNNLYYAGLRVDGTAVIKKKFAGTYTTLAQTKVYSGTYGRDAQSNLMPHDQWIGMRSEIVNTQDGVLIRFYVDKTQSGNWQLVLTTIDKNNPITIHGYGGIRGDFMDLKFRDYIQRGFSL